MTSPSSNLRYSDYFFNPSEQIPLSHRLLAGVALPIAGPLALLGSLTGCRQSHSAPAASASTAPASSSCIPSKFSRYFTPNFHLSQSDAESLCQIQETDTVVDLASQYQSCAQRLMQEGRYQAGDSILSSLWQNSTDVPYRRQITRSRLLYQRERSSDGSPFQESHQNHCYYNPFDVDHDFNYLLSLRVLVHPRTDSDASAQNRGLPVEAISTGAIACYNEPVCR